LFLEPSSYQSGR